jgi:hypothetical protein
MPTRVVRWASSAGVLFAATELPVNVSPASFYQLFVLSLDLVDRRLRMAKTGCAAKQRRLHATGLLSGLLFGQFDWTGLDQRFLLDQR